MDRIAELEEMELCVQALLRIAGESTDVVAVRLALLTLVNVKSGIIQLKQENNNGAR